MNNKYLKIFQTYELNSGRMISGSKSGYIEKNPEHFPLFNARIYTKKDYLNNQADIKDFFKGQELEIWYGDLELTQDVSKLYRAHLEIKEPLVITTEFGRKILEIGE